MDIKIGEYVRTKNCKNLPSLIGKVIDIDGDMLHLDCFEVNQVILPKDIISHSFNIIKVIEEGDIIEAFGKKVEVTSDYTNTPLETCNGVNHLCVIVRDDFKHNPFGYKIVDFEIDKVLTKEQYERNCCKVEE